MAIIAKGSNGVLYSRQFYQELLDRFSSLDKLVVGLVTITLRLRKVSANAVEFNSAKAQVWDRLIRSFQKHFPPRHVNQLVPEFSKTGVLITRNRLTKYGLVRYHKTGQLAIISHSDVKLSDLLLRRSHSAVEASSNIHCAGNLTNIRLRTGFFAVVMTRS